MPHVQRNLALLRLRAPVAATAPLALTATAPASGEALRVAGFGAGLHRSRWTARRPARGNSSTSDGTPHWSMYLLSDHHDGFVVSAGPLWAEADLRYHDKPVFWSYPADEDVVKSIGTMT